MGWLALYTAVLLSGCGGVSAVEGDATDPPACTEETDQEFCQRLGANCGEVTNFNNCGQSKTTVCGACMPPQVCGGGKVPWVCGSDVCIRKNCEMLSAECGTPDDGCGNTLKCGTCDVKGTICNEKNHVCVPLSCDAKTCESEGASCGGIEDGCGNTINCGSCEAPNECYLNQCVDCMGACQEGSCAPNACAGRCPCAKDQVCDPIINECKTKPVDCGDIGAVGCCQDDAVLFCDDFEGLSVKFCSSSEGLCGWNDSINNYGCGTAGYSDPSGANPMPCSTCTPDCDGKTCGPDGCGNACAQCPEGDVCVDTHCCTPACEGKDCGDDGCGGSCGTCGLGLYCVDQTCADCKPQCDGEPCLDDGCGNPCPGCDDGAACGGGGDPNVCEFHPTLVGVEGLLMAETTAFGRLFWTVDGVITGSSACCFDSIATALDNHPEKHIESLLPESKTNAVMGAIPPLTSVDGYIVLNTNGYYMIRYATEGTMTGKTHCCLSTVQAARKHVPDLNLIYLPVF